MIIIASFYIIYILSEFMKINEVIYFLVTFIAVMCYYFIANTDILIYIQWNQKTLLGNYSNEKNQDFHADQELHDTNVSDFYVWRLYFSFYLLFAFTWRTRYHVHAGKLVMDLLCICKFRINELIIKTS